MTATRVSTIGILGLAGVASIVLILSREDKLPVTFAGWKRAGTNLAEHAVFRFPPVSRSTPPAFFFKWRYEVGIEYVWKDSNGVMLTNSFIDSGGPSPVRTTDLEVPITPGTVSIRLLNAQTALHRYWDNFELPISPRIRQWSFHVPSEAISVPSSQQNTNVSADQLDSP